MHSEGAILQKKIACIWREASRIIHEEGFRAFWKGNLVTIAHRLPYTSVNFYAYERGLLLRGMQYTTRASLMRSKSYVKKKAFWAYIKDSEQHYWPNDSNVMVSLACGSLSGIASSTATFPLDLVRRRMQLEGACGRTRVYQNGLFTTFSQIVSHEGIHGMYRPEYYKVVPGVCIVFMTYESLKMLLTKISSSY